MSSYLFSDRSRALAQAYVLKKARRHSFFEKTKITGGGFLIIKKIEWEINNAFDFSEDFYGKIRLSWREKSLIV